MLSQRTKRSAALIELERQPRNPAVLPTLQLTRDGTPVQELSLELPQLLIGRTEDNDLAISSSYVSRYHILLIRHGGATILVDLNSTNGTFVNAQRVHNHVLANGDEITVDRHSMFVQYGLKYSDPSSTTHDASGDSASVDAVVEKALETMRNLLEKGDTDLLPTLSENVPTVVGFIDDR